jgi:hypothetical protein
MPRFARAAALALLLAASCGHVDYGAVGRGEFSGSLFVMWIGEGGPSGDGAFVFVPDPDDRLTFTRPGPAGAALSIRPEMMYTDGGSIPKPAQLFRGFSPWGYAPAYMVHDWLFVARHCLTDGTPTDEERRVADLGFRDSAVIIAEAIKTLVESGRVARNDAAAGAISGAVAGPISRRLWLRRGACAGHRLTDEDRRAAEAAFAARPAARLRGLSRVLPDGTEVPLAPARIVARVSF